MKAQMHRYVVRIPGYERIKLVARSKQDAKAKGLRIYCAETGTVPSLERIAAIGVEMTGSVKKYNSYRERNGLR